MAIRKIRVFGDPILAQPAEPVETIDDTIRDLVQDLLDTTNMDGRAGVAAPQIGVALRVFAYHIDDELGYLINPRIVSTAGERTLIEEGCLSVPDLWYPTPRYPSAVAEGIDLDGKPVRIEGTGVKAQMLQHEIDHLDGYVYIRRLEPATRKTAMRTIRQADWF